MRRRNQVYGLVFHHLCWRAMCSNCYCYRWRCCYSNTLCLLLNCFNIGCVEFDYSFALCEASVRRSLAPITFGEWAAYTCLNQRTHFKQSHTHTQNGKKSVMMSFVRFWAKSLIFKLAHLAPHHFFHRYNNSSICTYSFTICWPSEKPHKICIIFMTFQRHCFVVLSVYISMSLDLNCVNLCAIPTNCTQNIMAEIGSFFYGE